MFLAGYAGVHVVFSDLQDQVNRDLAFPSLLKNPPEHEGQLVVFGGWSYLRNGCPLPLASWCWSFS